MPIEWRWIPGASAGPFRFGELVGPYIAEFGLQKLDQLDSALLWDSFLIPGTDSRVSAEDGRITSVLCCDALEYAGIELLRKTVDEIRELLGAEQEFADGVGLGAAMYYTERFGLTLWIVDGIVDTASCGFTDEELDRQDREQRQS